MGGKERNPRGPRAKHSSRETLSRRAVSGLWGTVRVVHGGWEVNHKECSPVFGESAMDAEVQGCGLLMERMMS